MSQFIAKKIPNMEPVQVFLRLQSAFEIKNKSVSFVIVHLRLKI